MASLDFSNETAIFTKFYSENYEFLKAASEYFRTLINSMLLDQFPIENVIGRLKNCDECINKFNTKYREELENNQTPYEIRDHITDLIGVRVVCLYEPDIYSIKNFLEENFEVIGVTDKIKNIDATEDKFGYKSLHLDLKLNETRKNLPENKKYSDYQFEVQIRTIIQDAWSILDHKIIYKKTVPLDLKRRINRLAAIFELADDEFNSIKEETAKFKENAEHKNTGIEVLNIISFMDIVDQYFPTYQFIDYKADDFLHLLLSFNDKMTKEEFNNAISNNIEQIKKFNEYISSKTPYYNLNPYTIIRHCLYCYNETMFEHILFDLQKKSFTNWKNETQ